VKTQNREGIKLNHSTAAENKQVVCFTLWFRRHNNARYAVLFPQLEPGVQFYRVTLSHRRVIQGLQFRLWKVLKKTVTYPAMARYFAGQYSTAFTVDTDQISAWPKTQRVVVDMDDPVFSPTEFRLLRLPQVKAIVVTTDQAKAIYREQGVTCPIYVVPQGVSVEKIDEKRIREIRAQFKEGPNLVVGYHAPTLTLTSDGPRRARAGIDDLDFLFAVMEQARKIEPRMSLWLLGEASKSVKRYAAAHPGWIRTFGYVALSDILNYVSNFDIGVYPRTWAQPPGRFNVKLAQFMACGVPIISTNLDESFILREADCGIVCESEKDFSDALVELAKSAVKRSKLGKAGRSYAQANLDWAVLIPIYRDILSRVNHGR
jgi:glycosyltransferase involved in cell wall biosynthesis